MKKVTDIVAEIAAASHEQSAGIEQVNKAVMQLDELTQQNAALVEEASAASQAMAEQARGLNASMERYRVHEDGAESPAAETPVAVRRLAARPRRHRRPPPPPPSVASQQALESQARGRGTRRQRGEAARAATAPTTPPGTSSEKTGAAHGLQ